MRFKLVEGAETISICKFSKYKIGCTPKGVILTGKDKSGSQLRLPRRDITTFIPAKQIAEYRSCVYLPEDQIEDINTDLMRTYPQPEAIQEMPKWKWLQIKQEHPYRGI